MATFPASTAQIMSSRVCGLSSVTSILNKNDNDDCSQKIKAAAKGLLQTADHLRPSRQPSESM